MNQFINQPVVNWARQNLPQTVEVKLKGNSSGYRILLGFCFAFIAFIVLAFPVMIYIRVIEAFINEGLNEKVAAGLFGGTLFLVIFGGPALGIFLLMRSIRRKVAETLDSEGVKTRGGRKFVWENLYFLNYKKVNTRVRRNVAASVANAVMFAGVEKVTVEMIFGNGKAVVPPLLVNQPQILALLNSMPVQRRDEGTIRQ